MTRTLARTAPDRKHDAELNAVRMEGYVSGYRDGMQDAPFTAPPELIEAYKAAQKVYHRERKLDALLKIEAILKTMLGGNDE